MTVPDETLHLSPTSVPEKIVGSRDGTDAPRKGRGSERWDEEDEGDGGAERNPHPREASPWRPRLPLEAPSADPGLSR